MSYFRQICVPFSILKLHKCDAYQNGENFTMSSMVILSSACVLVSPLLFSYRLATPELLK